MQGTAARPAARAVRHGPAWLAVAGAARTLFLERGYAATTIEAISDLSDVPPATVYRLFSSKLGILKELLDVSIAGDDQAVALEDRPHVRALLADPDPAAETARARRRGHHSRTHVPRGLPAARR